MKLSFIGTLHVLFFSNNTMVLDKDTTRYVALMITRKCNLNCVYCYEKFKSTQTMDIDNAKKYILNSAT